jgi:hypothetical protein
MFNPLNNIEKININDVINEKYTSYTEHIKDKYKLSNEQMKILDLISLEEILAIRLEKSLRIFNGSMIFPLVEIYKQYIQQAYKQLVEFYAEETEVSKKILKAIAINKYTYYINKKTNGKKPKNI